MYSHVDYYYYWNNSRIIFFISSFIELIIAILITCWFWYESHFFFTNVVFVLLILSYVINVYWIYLWNNVLIREVFVWLKNAGVCNLMNWSNFDSYTIWKYLEDMSLFRVKKKKKKGEKLSDPIFCVSERVHWVKMLFLSENPKTNHHPV